MRRAVLVLILAIGCASGPPKPARMRIELFEARAQGQMITTIGPHVYVVRIHNTSEQPYTVQSVQLELAGTNDLELQGGLDTAQWPLESGQMTDIVISTSIAPTRGYNSSGMVPDISSLRVTVSCTSETGSFYESQTQYVSPMRRF